MRASSWPFCCRYSQNSITQTTVSWPALHPTQKSFCGSYELHHGAVESWILIGRVIFVQLNTVCINALVLIGYKYVGFFGTVDALEFLPKLRTFTFTTRATYIYKTEQLRFKDLAQVPNSGSAGVWTHDLLSKKPNALTTALVHIESNMTLWISMNKTAFLCKSETFHPWKKFTLHQ